MITQRNYLISTAPAWGWGLRTGTTTSGST